MTKQKDDQAPPRRIEPGDIVAVYCDELGEWTAAQITGLDADGATAGVLELDWSGPEPGSVEDLGAVRPLQLTHHTWSGKLAYGNCHWVLPRSYKVIGALPLMHEAASNSYGGWTVGRQLFLQRRWDSGRRDEWSEAGAVQCTGAELDLLLAEQADPDPAVRRLSVRGVVALDAGRLAARFPGLTGLALFGEPGTLFQASKLNGLASLRSLLIKDLFGMDASDCLLSSGAAALESLQLDSVPADYAAAMEASWRPEVPSGVRLDIVKPRKADWAEENRDNPFRDWDGDGYVPRAAYKKAMTQYKKTRDAVLAVLSDAPAGEPTAERAAQLGEIGERYGETFNEVDGRYGCIDTVERERLFEALDHIVATAEGRLGVELKWAGESLAEGVESVRDW